MYDIAVLAATRVHLLERVLSSIEKAFGQDARTHVWIDYNANRRNRVVETARRYANASPEHSVRGENDEEIERLGCVWSQKQSHRAR